jgi:O-antigen/teichoic acid export membrane protein
LSARTPAWVTRAVRTFAVNLAGVGLGFLLQLVLARLLGVGEYGRYIYAITWVTMVAVVCVLGLDAASLRFIPEHEARAEGAAARGFLDFAQRRALMLATVVAVPMSALAVGVASAYGHRAWWVVALCALLLPWTVLFHLRGYFLLALKRSDEALSLQLLLRPLLLLCACLAAVRWWHALDAFDALLLTFGATALVVRLEGWRVRRLTPPGGNSFDDRAMRRRWTSTATSLFLVTLAHQVLANGDILLVGLLIGTTDAGVYAVCAKLAAIVSFATSSINLSLAPTIAELHARGQREELQAAVTTATRAAFAYAVPVLAVLALGGGWLLHQFGTGFERGYGCLVLLSLGQAAVTFNGAVGFLLTMTGHHETALRVVGVTAALMVLLGLVAGHLWGAPGVAAAVAVAQGVRSLALGHFVQRLLGVHAGATI